MFCQLFKEYIVFDNSNRFVLLNIFFFLILRYPPPCLLLVIVFLRKTSILKVILSDTFHQNLSFTFVLLQLLLLSNVAAENPGPENKVSDLTC